MKIIFLDIDGVINREDITGKRLSDNIIEDDKLKIIKYITEKTGAKVVLTSSWRMHLKGDKLKYDDIGIYINGCFYNNHIDIIDTTDDLGFMFSRNDEINLWLEKHSDIKSYVIIDDYCYNFKKNKFVKINGKTGITNYDAQKAIKILMKTDENYS